MIVSRREMFKLLAAGATVIAGEIWVPGKTILIPSKPEIFLYGVTMEPVPGYSHHQFGNALIESLATSTPHWKLSWYERHKGSIQEWRHYSRMLESWEAVPYPVSKAFSEKGMHIQQPPKEANHGT